MKLRWFRNLLLIGGVVVLWAITVEAESLTRPVCTTAALAMITREIPNFSVHCPTGVEEKKTNFDWSRPETRALDPSWRDAVARYSQDLSRWATPEWWAVAPDAMAACRVHKKVGQVTQEEAESWGFLAAAQQVQGDVTTRLIVTSDPCLPEGNSSAFMGFFLNRKGGKTIVTPAFDTYLSRFDVPISLQTTRVPFKVMVIDKMNHDGYFTYSTLTAYRADAATGEIRPYPVFRTGAGTSASVRNDIPMNFDGGDLSGKIVTHQGTLAKRFFVYEKDEDGFDKQLKSAPIRHPFTWSGSVFVMDHLSEDARVLKECREKIKAVFAKGVPEDGVGLFCPWRFHCEEENDLAWLYLQHGVLERANEHAVSALSYCNDAPDNEQHAAIYNYQMTQKAKK